MASPERLLFFTNSEYGQANIILATIYEPALRGYEIHLASFAPLQASVLELQDIIREDASKPSFELHFHIIPGPSMLEQWKQRGIKLFHPPGMLSVLRAYNQVIEAMAPWSVEEYVNMYSFCVDLIQSIQPKMTLVDSLFSQGVDACSKFPGRYFVFNAISHRNIIALKQPISKILFSYSAAFSGIRVPLPWYHMLFLTSFWLALYFSLCVQLSSYLHPFKEFRKAEGLRGRFPAFKLCVKRVLYLCPSLPETDLNYPVIPPNVILCGPMIPRPSLSSSLYDDTELHEWLQRGQTIMINLGTLAEFGVAWVQEMAAAIRLATSRPARVQFLWKLKSGENGDLTARNLLSDLIVEGRVRISTWLKTSPVNLLRSGHIVCSVHHGGANTYYEAAWAGVPQIVLPTWFDTYDFAVRAVALGIGIYGNESTAPNIDGEELGNAFSKVILDVQTRGPLTRNAEALGVLCQRSGGCKTAADAIVNSLE